MNIAIQGIKGSFHDEVASILHKNSDILECETFEQVFHSVESGEADKGIVAIENSLQGSINQTYRLLARSDLKIVGEHLLDVEQYLIGTRAQELKSLNSPDTKIYSMFPAFSQVEGWLEVNLPEAEKVEYFDTAASVKKIMQGGHAHELAVAGKRAAELYGGTILAGPINDHKHNKTRFLVIQKVDQDKLLGSTTSIILTTDHTSGALYRSLGVFERLDINLTKLDSYPIAGDRRHYMFYIDFEAGLQDIKAKTAIKQLENMGSTVKVLGSF